MRHAADAVRDGDNTSWRSAPFAPVHGFENCSASVEARGVSLLLPLSVCGAAYSLALQRWRRQRQGRRAPKRVGVRCGVGTSTLLTSPHPSPRAACPPLRFRDVQPSCRNKTVLSSVGRRSCLLRQCYRCFETHRHPHCNDVLVGIQMPGNKNDQATTDASAAFFD